MPLDIQPQGGRLVRRAVQGGAAWAGVLHLPSHFVPEEGRAYGCLLSPSGILLDSTPATGKLDPSMLSFGVADLLTQQIWPRPAVPKAISLRFLEAFPQDNVWTVFGPSPIAVNPNGPSHAWFDVLASGEVQSIAAPFDAAGMGFGQVLNMGAVWPDRSGRLYTLPSNQAAIRPHYLEYHKLLASAARDPSVDKVLEKIIAADPVLNQLSCGQVDRAYCAFVAQQEDEGLLEMERPRTLEEHAARERAMAGILKRSLERQELPVSPLRHRMR